jgi:hypothetical protein
MIGTQAYCRSLGNGEGLTAETVSVGERTALRRRSTVTTTGARGSEDPDMSSDKKSAKLFRRQPKVSWGRQFRPGVVGTYAEAEGRRRWTMRQHSYTALHLSKGGRDSQSLA